MVFFRLRLALLSLVSTSGAGAFAQDRVVLQPDQFNFETSSLSVRLSTLTPEKQLNVMSEKLNVRWLFVRTGAVQENRDTLDEWVQADGSLRLPVAGEGGVLIGIDLQPKLEDMNPVDVSRLVGRPLARMTGTVKVRRFRSATLIARKSSPAGTVSPSSSATSEVSLSSSVRPLMDPTTLFFGGDVAFEYLAGGIEVEEAKILVFNVTDSTTIVLRGENRHFTPRPGCEYRVTVDSAVPVQNDPEASFNFYSTTLAFKVPARTGGLQ